MDDLVSEYGFTIVILLIGSGIVGALASLLTKIWNGGMFL